MRVSPVQPADALGKTLSTALIRMEVEVPDGTI